MLEKISLLEQKARHDLSLVNDLKALENWRIQYLGRKSEINKLLRELKNLSLDDKRRVGPIVQKLKKDFENWLKEQQTKIQNNIEFDSRSFFDITKPGKRLQVGHLHPLSKIEEEIERIFSSLNFSVVEGPEVENEYYNFDALNVPPYHPARDMWDTFWLKKGMRLNNDQAGHFLKKTNSSLLLRTHTSPMQIRYMESHQPPFQIIVPGRVFRYEATDFSHEINFHQIEGLMIGKDISLANFKFIIETFFKKLFKSDIDFRYRPAYFPFTEPSIEVLIKFRGNWLEVMGAGMVHRKVFEAVRYNPYEWQGFAFGMCLERLTMIKYNIPDIRLFYSGDLRFIEQF
jgi:phenylalanyl-tRNA synthetase alpha chain